MMLPRHYQGPAWVKKICILYMNRHAKKDICSGRSHLKLIPETAHEQVLGQGLGQGHPPTLDQGLLVSVHDWSQTQG